MFHSVLCQKFIDRTIGRGKCQTGKIRIQFLACPVAFAGGPEILPRQMGAGG